MSAEVSYIEIGSGESGRTRTFLQELFRWEFHPMGDGGNGWFDTPTMRAGLHGSDPEPGILVFFSVVDLEAAAARVRELGGEADEPGEEEPGFGRFVCAAIRRECGSDFIGNSRKLRFSR